MNGLREKLKALFSKRDNLPESFEDSFASLSKNEAIEKDKEATKPQSVDSITPCAETDNNDSLTPVSDPEVPFEAENDPPAEKRNIDLSHLNSYQLAAVENTDRACLVNACVGSGKTTVLTTKILYLHEKGVSFSDMVVLTFTNKAANEIKDRIHAAYPDIREDDMQYFGTFHSVALRMLKTIMPLNDTGFTSDFTVISPDEQVEMAQNLIEQNGLNIKYLNKLSGRLEMAFTGQYLYGNMKYGDHIESLITMLRKEQIKQNKMSFDDLIDFSTALMPMVSYRPKWIFVDEFQDGDERLYYFIQSMVNDDTHLFAVGDPNQIIYSWRGSDKDIFSRYIVDYHAVQLSLPVNYRSCATILDAAKALLGKSADLQGVRDTGARIVIKTHYNPFQEAEYLAARIKEIIEQGNHYSDIAILYRLQKFSQTLEEVLQRQEIPFTVSVRKTLKDIPVLNWLVRLLRYSINTRDTDSAVLALTDKQYGPCMSRRDARNILDINDMLKKASELKQYAAEMASAEDLYTYFDLQQQLRPNSISFVEDKEYVDALLKSIDEFRQKNGYDLFRAISEFIASSALYGVDFLQADNTQPKKAVNLLTMHAAKGLEYKYVFIIGANQGVIPLMRSRGDFDEDEEKRLFFVGLTRAKDNLEISYYTMPDTVYAAPVPSPYLFALPQNLVEWQKKVQPCSSSQAATLQSLRHMVKQQSESEQFTLFQNMQSEPKQENSPQGKKAVHAHYGEGIVIAEDDLTITVRFDGFGEKQFMKMFNEVSVED
jgi:DNA helicase-2/ATP-dependent DNA helicase PcrA